MSSPLANCDKSSPETMRLGFGTGVPWRGTHSHEKSEAEAEKPPLPPEFEEAEGLVVLEVWALPRPLTLVARPTLLVLLDRIKLHGMPHSNTGYKASSGYESRED